MKPLNTFLFALMVASLPVAEARDGGGRSSGRSGGGGSSGGSAVKRSPATGSKISRPTPKPAPQPASRPSSKPDVSNRPTTKPAPRPESKPVSKPESKPAPRPEARPETKPAQRPSVERPTTRPGDGNNRPGDGNSNRPGNGGDNNFNRPGNGGNGSGNNRPGDGGNRPGDGSNRPGDGNNNRPGNGGDNNFNRPGNGNGGNGSGNNRPGDGNNRPGNGNGNNRPDDGRPNYDRPNKNDRPNTLPGMVTYPDRPNNQRPDRGGNVNFGNGNNGNGNGNGNGNNIGNGNNNGNKNVKIDNSQKNNVYIEKTNVNRRNNGLNRPSTLPANRKNWDNNKWGGNRSVWGNNNNININNNIKVNNNYKHNYNYAYRPNYWGARPWWGASSYHGWHHGCWNYGYNSHYYSHRYYYSDSSFASGFMWGIGVWSLGNLIYDMGYQSYRNPYPAPPIQSGDSKSSISYSQPISVTAAANPPGDEEVVKLAETKSDESLERSRTAFRKGDYIAALKADEEAIAYTPGDSTLHEYRALCLFALGKYGDAAGVLNSVLASGPGWGWDTMVDFYPSSTVYDEQLRRLEAYVKGTPTAADGHFLLGYHYLVCGYTEKAYEQFSRTVELQPADSIARQLRDLMKDSLPDDGSSTQEAPEPPAPIPSEKLVGTWVNVPATGGQITFKMEENGDFNWSFVNGEKSSELKGTYGLDDKGLLVLTADDSQMISTVTLTKDTEMNFVLVGSPTGDPGLDFRKN